MTDEKLKRINALAKKSKTAEGLTEAEKEEQQKLRKEYIASFKQNLVAQLDNVYLVDEKGQKKKLQKKSNTPLS